ncbi:hypothetical protein M8C21_006312, partial [Ambrosia artemisiifolia]
MAIANVVLMKNNCTSSFDDIQANFGSEVGSDSKGVTYSAHRSIGIALFSLATVQ